MKEKFVQKVMLEKKNCIANGNVNKINKIKL